MKMQHFVDSGIGAIWICPIYTSPMLDFGYDISDFKGIDESFGTLQDFEELIKKAKELGVKVSIPIKLIENQLLEIEFSEFLFYPGSYGFRTKSYV